jgi:hypothetical protein
MSVLLSFIPCILHRSHIRRGLCRPQLSHELGMLQSASAAMVRSGPPVLHRVAPATLLVAVWLLRRGVLGQFFV